MAEINRVLPGRAVANITFCTISRVRGYGAHKVWTNATEHFKLSDAFDERVHSLGGDYRETAWVHAMSSSRACVMLTVSFFGL
jgi:hypothetical protein